MSTNRLNHAFIIPGAKVTWRNLGVTILSIELAARPIDVPLTHTVEQILLALSLSFDYMTPSNSFSRAGPPLERGVFVSGNGAMVELEIFSCASSMRRTQFVRPSPLSLIRAILRAAANAKLGRPGVLKPVRAGFGHCSPIS